MNHGIHQFSGQERRFLCLPMLGKLFHDRALLGAAFASELKLQLLQLGLQPGNQGFRIPAGCMNLAVAVLLFQKVRPDLAELL